MTTEPRRSAEIAAPSCTRCEDERRGLSSSHQHTCGGQAAEQACPVCTQRGVVVGHPGSRWRKCRNCDASWNSRYTEPSLPPEAPSGGDSS